ncbi:unnamed protein product, partial [Prorocentrum cordatum]
GARRAVWPLARGRGPSEEGPEERPGGPGEGAPVAAGELGRRAPQGGSGALGGRGP